MLSGALDLGKGSGIRDHIPGQAQGDILVAPVQIWKYVQNCINFNLFTSLRINNNKPNQSSSTLHIFIYIGAYLLEQFIDKQEGACFIAHSPKYYVCS